jgi:Beta-lactamase superfamily domain
MHNTSFRYLNHASILIRCASNFILTDPWFQRPAFGSWLPVPPIAIHPAYIQTLARSTQDFMIVISHGHDDHLDDEWLVGFPKHVLVLIPEFPAPGTRKRIEALGFKKIIEIPALGIQIGNIRFQTFFNPEISRFDAIISIDTGDSLIVHANDNWKPLTERNRNRLSELTHKYGLERTCYLSQCNIADSFPYVYPQYDIQEKKIIANKRVESMARSSLQNAASIGARYFLNYAGHTKTFDFYNPHMLGLTGFQDYQFIRKIALEEELENLEVLDMVPGDSFDFKSIDKLFGFRLDESILKEESVSYY